MWFEALETTSRARKEAESGAKVPSLRRSAAMGSLQCCHEKQPSELLRHVLASCSIGELAVTAH